MSALKDYRIVETIHHGELTLIDRAIQLTDNRPVILKSLRKAQPTPADHLRLQLEYDNTRLFDDAHIIGAVECLTQVNVPTLVLEDFGGISLDRVIAREHLNLETCLKIALKVIHGMECLHSKGMVHKDINPSNITWNRETDQVNIIDLGFATVPPVARAVRFDTDFVEGTLLYIAPEQTGRINRQLDYRSDFYSFGATLYEMVTGVPPFQFGDAMELVHAHIAKQPTPPHELDERVPAYISSVILKLLAKTAEERYQSTYGLRQDIETCLRWLREGEGDDNFEPGSQDISSTFTVTQNLYGRKSEAETLLKAFERVNQGSRELVMVGGYSGIGKTTLVNEVQKTVVEKRGNFVSGKFDQLNRCIPYHAFIQAFKELVRHLLSENEVKIQQWRQRLQDALGPNGQVVVSVIPEVVHIIGPQPGIQNLPPEESQNRFKLVFQRFIQAFCTAEHPLILFLDDLQWADSASLQLLELMISDSETGHLLVLGTFRDNEVDGAHPLTLTLEQIRKARATISEITLQPLDLQHVSSIIADSLQTDEQRVQTLAEACMAKTQGNPFFLIQLLHNLHSRGYIHFDRKLGQWGWDPNQIAGSVIPDKVVDLMVDKIGHLPDSTREALERSAAIGERFDLKTLAIVHEQTEDECIRALSPAVQSGLIYPIGGSRVVAEASDNQESVYRFLHDRVHQAAYSLISDDQKQAAHLRIGHLLLQRLDSAQRSEHIFELVNHLNLGISLIDDPGERMDVARLNHEAGQKAKSSAANSAAYGYFTQGIDLLPAGSWEQHYALTLALHEEAAEAAYLCHRYDDMEALVERILTHAADNLQKAKACRIRILSNTARNDLKAAVECGLEYLRTLEVEFSQPVDPQAIGEGLGHIRESLGDRRIESLSRLPKMTDPRALVIMDTLTALASPAYNYSPELFILLVLKQVEISLQRGNAPHSTFAYSIYALVLCSAEGRYEDGDAFGRLAIDLMKRLNAQHFKGKIYLTVYLFVHHWRHPLRETLSPLLESYRSAMDQGDLLFAALSAHVYCHHTLFSARNLAETASEFATYHKAITRLDQQAVVSWTEIFQQTVLNLMDEDGNPLELIGEAFNEVEESHLFQQENDKTVCFLYYFNKLILACLFNAKEQALEHAQQAEKYLHSVMGIIHVPLCRYYACLTRLAVAGNAQSEERDGLLASVEQHREELAEWAQSAPMNYAHKHKLVEAEYWRLSGDQNRAEAYYDQAISMAGENGYTHDEAQANEKAGIYYLSKGRLKIAQMYLSEALQAYSRWGATSKVAVLQEKYGELLAGAVIHRESKPVDHRRSSQTAMHNLNLTSVLKVSQTITEEIVLEFLLDKVMTTVMENAGAQRGFLISTDAEGEWHVDVKANMAAKKVQVFKSDALENRDDLSSAIVHYVARTREPLVLHDAANEGLFVTDRYVLEYHPKSILCMPLSHRGRVTAILYLENNLITDAFTPSHLELLELLSSQMAVSIENAKLYVGMEEMVAERTEQLYEKVDELSRAYETLQHTQSELKQANAKLERDKELLQELSSTDRLTKLYNRAKLEELFEYEIRQSQRYKTPLSVIMVDLDHFKKVNDTYGHHVGDMVLQNMAEILSKTSRASDVVARWGGEEFLILAPKTNLDQAFQLAEKVRVAIEGYNFDQVGQKTGSFGVACYREMETLSALLQRADIAMYQAKNGGRNRVVVED